jgi:hypothetical protein
MLYAYFERVRDNLYDLGVQSLAHLDAAVIDEHTAVGVHVYQRSRLVERGESEREPEFGRQHRQAALAPPLSRHAHATPTHDTAHHA